MVATTQFGGLVGLTDDMPAADQRGAICDAQGPTAVSPPPRVLIAHYGLMRHSMRMALVDYAEICAEADDAAGASAEAQRTLPDVCIVGWEIPGDGATAVRGILAAVPHAAVIVVADRQDVDDMLAALRAGAVGYLPGSLDADQLRRVVRGVAGEEAAVPRGMVLELLRELRATEVRSGVTAREAQVLGMLRRGRSTAEIATRLEISPVTVRRHISDLVRKLGFENRTALINDAGGGPTGGPVALTAADRPAGSGQTDANGVGGGLDPVWHVELGEDARDVVLRRSRADA